MLAGTTLLGRRRSARGQDIIAVILQIYQDDTDKQDRKNALEEYVYDMRGKLDGRYAPFVQQSEKDELLAGLSAAEDWLYTEEGEDATKSQYVEKLDKLKVLGDQIVFRWKESEDRPKAAAALRELANDFLSKAQSGDAAYEHIGQEDLQKVVSVYLFCLGLTADMVTSTFIFAQLLYGVVLMSRLKKRPSPSTGSATSSHAKKTSPRTSSPSSLRPKSTRSAKTSSTSVDPSCRAPSPSPR